jgi:hypothetical protein
VKEQDFAMFLELLDQERGEFLRKLSLSVDDVYTDILFNASPACTFRFETLSQYTIDEAPFDSESLVQYCTNAESAR